MRAAGFSVIFFPTSLFSCSVSLFFFFHHSLLPQNTGLGVIIVYLEARWSLTLTRNKKLICSVDGWDHMLLTRWFPIWAMCCTLYYDTLELLALLNSFPISEIFGFWIDMSAHWACASVVPGLWSCPSHLHRLHRASRTIIKKSLVSAEKTAFMVWLRTTLTTRCATSPTISVPMP